MLHVVENQNDFIYSSLSGENVCQRTSATRFQEAKSNTYDYFLLIDWLRKTLQFLLYI